jgi:hypothetical protein
MPAERNQVISLKFIFPARDFVVLTNCKNVYIEINLKSICNYYHGFKTSVCLEEKSLGHTLHRSTVLNTFVVFQCFVNGGDNEVRHLRAHSVLHLQCHTTLSVVDHPLKEGDVKVVELFQFVHSNGRT